MAPDFQIAVAGGGLAGLTAALALSKLGFDTAVISPPPPTSLMDFRTSALLPTSVKFLQSLDLWGMIAEESQPFWTMRLIDDAASTRGHGAVTDFTSDAQTEEPLAYNVPNAGLHRALSKSLTETSVTFIRATVADIELEGCPLIKLSNGQTITAGLLVAADGRHSICREKAGIHCYHIPGRQFAITCQFEHSQSHKAISTEFQRRGGPFTFVPMVGNKSSLVWIEPQEKGEDLIKLSQADLAKQIQRRMRGYLGQVELLSKPQGFPIRSQVAQKFYAPGLALVAEAAHVLPPTGAQGLNLSLTDIATLTDIVSESVDMVPNLSDSSLLSLYESRRLPDVLARFGFSNSLNLLTAAKSPFGQTVRRTGLALLRGLPPVKRQLTRLGLQPLGYIPSSMQ